MRLLSRCAGKPPRRPPIRGSSSTFSWKVGRRGRAKGHRARRGTGRILLRPELNRHIPRAPQQRELRLRRDPRGSEHRSSFELGQAATGEQKPDRECGAAFQAAMTAFKRACLPEHERHAGPKAVVAG